jgi:hypothetical protein
METHVSELAFFSLLLPHQKQVLARQLFRLRALFWLVLPLEDVFDELELQKKCS